ncbi:DUF5994 family protein [Gordonia sp. SL306]|uniref:DUF5994 family protein n=1 Tax=Gordonia sp. SL306 TaxID=2995145 RepID=UPI00226D9227|nr:DUF5994 family protein [Gordonia sp. SL306]WAC55545.1 DUF5994 family protein [Gordonia sp. SL306]
MTPTTSARSISTDARVSFKAQVTRNDHVDGAWWPQSDDLHAELITLLHSVEARVNPVARVVFHMGDWSQPPVSRTVIDDHMVRFDGYHDWPTGAVKLRGPGDRDALTLMVIPPGTDADAAALVTTAAADPANTMTIGELLEQCTPSLNVDEQPSS